MVQKESKYFVIFIFWVLFGQILAFTCTPKCGVPGKWLPAAKNLCYGTKNDAFGTFTIDKDCHLYKIRLVHVSGYQTCCSSKPTSHSRWGHNGEILEQIGTVMLKEKQLWQPKEIHFEKGFYKLKGFYNNDDVIVFKTNETLIAGTKLQVAFGPDYRNFNEKPNEGTHCVDVDVSCIV